MTQPIPESMATFLAPSPEVFKRLVSAIGQQLYAGCASATVLQYHIGREATSRAKMDEAITLLNVICDSHCGLVAEALERNDIVAARRHVAGENLALVAIRLLEYHRDGDANDLAAAHAIFNDVWVAVAQLYPPVTRRSEIVDDRLIVDCFGSLVPRMEVLDWMKYEDKVGVPW